MDVNYWVIAKKAAMIFVPVVDQKISKEIFYCSLCKSWLKISNSFKNIRRHIFVHIPNFDDGNGDNDDDSDNENEGKMTNLKKKKTFSKEQEKIITRNIVLFILFRTQTFQYIEDKYLNELSSQLPDRKK